MKQGLLLAFTFLTGIIASAQMTVSTGSSGAALAAAFAGSGLTVTNVSISCPSSQYGTFNNGLASGMGITNGVILTTGSASTLSGTGNSNDDWSTWNTFSTSSDPQLQGVIGAGTDVYDACIIQFDVVPQCNNIQLVFVFGSDEYTNWVNSSFNDGFGFFVTGPNPAGGNYTNYNVALLPNGTQVSIDNVNQTSNSSYFVNNNSGTYANHFDGFTTVLTPSFNVTPCQTYHFKLAIGDASDGMVDSGVLIDLIQCSSPLTANVTSTNASCTSGGSATATVTGGLGPFTYSWSPSGGIGSTASNLSPGTYTVTIDDAISCQPPITYTVNIGTSATPPSMTAPPSQTVCNGASVSIPAFTSTPTGATFNWTSSNSTIGLAASGTGNIPTFTATNSGSSPVTSTITVTPTLSGCTGTPVTFTITVNPTVTPTFTNPGPLCTGTAFTLPTTSNNGITGAWSPAVNNTATTTYTFTPTAGQCATTVTMTVVINSQTTPTFTNPGPVCSGTAFTLPTTSNNGIVGTWSPAVNNTTTTTYTFTPNAGQCAVSTTMTVTVNPLVTPTFTNPGPLCSGTAFTLPTTSNNSITGTWSPAANNTATTTYTFTPTAGQCATTITMTVNITPQTVPTFTNPGPLCSGTAFTLPTTSNNSVTGTWSPAVNNTTTTTYTFTPTAGQCATTTTMTVAITPQTIPSFTQLGPYCQQATPGALPATSTNSVSGTWSPATISTATVGNTVYTFTPTAGQCATTETMTISVTAPNITPAFTQLGPYCQNTTPGTFATTSTNGISGSWSPPTVSTAAVGNVTYTFTPTTGQCAVSTTMVIQTTAPNITPTFTPIPNQCLNSTPPSLPATSTNGINGSWSPSTVSTATTGSTTYTFTPATGQCAISTTMIVTVGPPSVPQFTQIAPFCEGFASPSLPALSNDGFTGTWSPSTIDNMNPGTYTFTPNSGQCATTTTMDITLTPRSNPTFSPQPAYCQGATVAAIPNTSNDNYSGTWSPAWSNTTTTTYTFTPNGNECANPVQATITINAPTVPDFANPAAFCYGTVAPNLLTTSPNGISGTWSPATINNTNAGTYTFTPNANECATNQSVNSTINPLPVFSVSSNSPLCPGYPLTLNSSIAGSSYSWNGPAGFSSTQASPTIPSVTMADGGTYSLQLTDANGCVDTYSTDVVVNTTLPPTLTPIGPFCASESTPQGLVADYAGGTWTGTGVSGTDFVPSQAGAGTFTLTYTHTVGCGGTNTMDVVVLPNPPATFTADLLNGCEPITVNFSADPNATATHWDFGDGVTSDDIGTTTHIYDTPGDYTVSISMTVNGCDGASAQVDYIQVYPNPVASFTPTNSEITMTDPTTSFENHSVNADSYSWNFGDGSASTVENPQHTYPEEVSDYRVMLAVATIHGCVDTTYMNVRVKPELLIYVPNVFTPDGDEYNNTFYPVISGDFDKEHFTMFIFDRWGEIIFESHNDEIGWDGTYHEKYVQDGVYTWTIKLKHKYDDKYETFVGSVSILR